VAERCLTSWSLPWYGLSTLDNGNEHLSCPNFSLFNQFVANQKEVWSVIFTLLVDGQEHR